MRLGTVAGVTASAARSGSGPTPDVLAFRLPRSAYLAVLFLALCVTPLVQHPALAVVYLVPVLAAAFVARSATLVDGAAITVQALVGRRTVPWSDVRALSVDGRGRVFLGASNGRVLRLPFVRARHLPLLARTGGQNWPVSSPPPPR